jgi:hypothetical protein
MNKAGNGIRSWALCPGARRILVLGASQGCSGEIQHEEVEGLFNPGGGMMAIMALLGWDGNSFLPVYFFCI